MKTFRVKVFLFVEADNEDEAEQIAEEVVRSVSMDKEKASVRKNSAKLIVGREGTNGD